MDNSTVTFIIGSISLVRPETFTGPLPSDTGPPPDFNPTPVKPGEPHWVCDAIYITKSGQVKACAAANQLDQDYCRNWHIVGGDSEALTGCRNKKRDYCTKRVGYCPTDKMINSIYPPSGIYDKDTELQVNGLQWRLRVLWHFQVAKAISEGRASGNFHEMVFNHLDEFSQEQVIISPLLADS